MTLSYIVTIMNIPSNTVEKFGKWLKCATKEQQNRPKQDASNLIQ